MPDTIDRRRFLGHAAAGSAAVGLALADDLAAAEAADQRVTVGVMGLSRGMPWQGVLPAYLGSM